MQRETNTVDYVAKTTRKRATSPKRRNSNKSENVIANCKFCGGQHARGTVLLTTKSVITVQSFIILQNAVI